MPKNDLCNSEIKFWRDVIKRARKRRESEQIIIERAQESITKLKQEAKSK